MDLDPIDIRILRELQADGRLTNVELADRAGLSPSPCLRRVKALEAAGVIRGYHAALDREALGLGLTVFVGVKVMHRPAEATPTFWEAVQTLPEVITCHLVSGEADFLLQVVVPDLAAYERFLLGTLLKLPGVTDVRSNFAIKAVKPDARLPLGHLPSPVRG
ncbi:Lrp/AsnC family transcriptional regulator [Inquilinus limosus]|uniref:AsnC family transcriptional regulator n=1 Tax=Inquilinus limosus TaxID=171674 RepID=A0A211ZF20_9PROT|nr:Lrp/AsnC family transcriptional regulator [Inquilinus limosus]OWJ63888.1 AsnC family transcriptional regulator [Inquilinus limosus]